MFNDFGTYEIYVTVQDKESAIDALNNHEDAPDA